jgi:hypothetical protein
MPDFVAVLEAMETPQLAIFQIRKRYQYIGYVSLDVM